MSDKYVLLVEDNSDDVLLTELAFRKCQITNKLTVVCDGEKALEFLFSRDKNADRDHGQNPALIMLDLKLPCVSGLEIIKQIRSDENTSSVPVVVLTSSVEETDREESLRLGANDFFIKPMGFGQFVGLIQELRSKWLD